MKEDENNDEQPIDIYFFFVSEQVDECYAFKCAYFLSSSYIFI